ncbi:hypothetical protein D4764_12G0006070 [Takifugu flavidus]|uniref:Interferon-induced very large GTPase 1 domain-containing protein n=1 Tax=Takifugu flavidus TaxID=433684 RepID=A0A5C6PFW0_9TELE|nr:hypothetical protein D4764_12G0006070 [Takifugu flavidus]
MATAQDVLNGLEEGSRQYKEKQLPLQGHLWSKLAEIERKERKHTKEGKETDPHNKRKDEILAELNGYKMTQAMKTFSHALLTADKMERTFFLHWMKLRLQEIQSEKKTFPQTSVINTEIGTNGDVNENHLVVENGENFELEDSDSFCTDSTIEEEETEEKLRNMELEVPERSAEISQEVISTEWTADDESTSHQEESMCGPCLVEELHVASEVCCEDGTDEKEDFGEQMSDPQENEDLSFEREQVDEQQENCRMRVLTNLGAHHARNAAVLSALFAVTFPGGTSTKGIYMLILSVPNNLKEDIGDELESNVALIVNALLCAKECGSMPFCQFLLQEFSQWQESFLEHMESWLSRTRQKIFATKANNAIHSGFVDEAEEEVKTEAEKLKSKVEVYFMNQDLLKNTSFKPFLLRNVEHLQEQVTINLKEKLMAINENHCSATQLQTFEALLEKEQQSKLQAMIENSKSNQALLQDAQLEKEFEAMWSHILSNFDFRPSETEDITARVRNVLRENLMSRGLQKHLKKLDDIGQNQTPDNHNQKFYIHDEHFGYRSRLKHMFEDNNRLQKLEAQQLACHIIEQCEQFVKEKSSSHADFSDSYIKDLLENVERGLNDKSIEIKSVFEVDLKIFLCHAACQDFQKLHDRYAKDRELLQHISANKRVYLAEFMYQYRKMDQCHHTARAFTSTVLRPTVLSYVHRNLAMLIADEVRGQAPQYKSQHAFHQSLLEELISEDAFENLVDYLHSFDDFRLRRLQEKVVAHLSQSNNLITWRQQRLGEIVGLIATAVSEAAEGTAGVLSDAKPLLERVCLTLERDGDVEVARAAMDGPLFSITVKWDYFVTCLLELLAAMRLELAQEFTENKDAAQFLQNLPVQPHEYLLERVKGCEKRCPICGTPCEVEESGHRVHRATLHRPISMLPNKTHPLSNKSSPESRTNLDASNETDGASLACSGLHYPEWIPCSEDPNLQFPSAYWRYVLVRFNDRFAKEYQQDPTKIPEEWTKITGNEALDSLKESFSTALC